MFSEEKYKSIDHFVDDALKSEPDYLLPDNFADVVAEKMAKKFAWQQYILEFLVYLSAFVGLSSMIVGMQFIFFGAQLMDWLQFITENVFAISGITIILLFVLFTDRVLLQYFLYKSSLAKE